MSGEYQGLPIVHVADRDAWAAWLAENGAGVPGIWLKLAKPGAPSPCVAKADAVEGALAEGWIDGQPAKLDAHYWLLRFTPRRARSIWSQINRATAERLIAEGKMRPRGLAEVERATADGRWDAAYPPASKAEVPDDLRAALDADPKAAAFFATLTGVNRYVILHRVHEAKKPETRAARIAKFVAMCASGDTVY